MTKDLTIKEIAAELSLHPESVRRLARSGKLPFMFMVGGAWRGSRTELAKFKRTGGARPVGRPASKDGGTNA